MKKALIIIFVLCFIMGNSLTAKIVYTFDNILQPSSMVIDGNNLYVVENVNVYIFSMKDFKLIKKFGKQGEGPKEFNRFVSIYPLKDKLLVNSFGKISYYTKTGDYLSETKTKSGIVFTYLPLGDKYVGYSFSAKDKTRYRSINVYNSKLEKIRTLINQEDDNQFGKGQIKILNSTLTLATFNDRLYVVNGKKLEIKVFDKEVKDLFTISKEYKRPKFTDKDKQMIIDEIKSNPRQKQFFQAIKKMMIFPDYFPSIAALFERDNIIFVMTFKREKDKYEFFLFDTEGSFLDKLFIPFAFQSPMRPFPFSIQSGNLYQLVENDDEEWDLVSNPIYASMEKYNKLTEHVRKETNLKHK